MNDPQSLDPISGRETLRIFRRALRYVAPFRGGFALKVGLTMLSLAPLLFLPWPLKIVIDHVVRGLPVPDPSSRYPFFMQPFLDRLVGASAEEIMLAMAVLMGVTALLIGAFGTQAAERDQTSGWLSSGRDTATRTENEANLGWSFAGGFLGLIEFRWTIRLTQALNHHYRSLLFDRIQSLPMTAFDDERVGDAIYRVMYDTPAITGFSYRLLLTPIVAPVQIVLTSALMWLVYEQSPGIAWAGLAFAPLVFVGTLPFSAALRRRGEESRRAGSVTASTVEEGVSNVLAVQSLGGQDRERRRFERDSWRSFGAYRAYVRTLILGTLSAGLFGLGLVSWVLLQVSDLTIRGELTVGDFGVLLAYFAQIAAASARLGGLWFGLQGNAAGLPRVVWLMDLPGEQDPPGNHPLPAVRDRVRLENVSFSYADGTPALDRIDLEVRSGQLTAIVGPAGSGKTTLAYTIPRFVSPSEGRVLIDDTDISTVTLTSLRSQVAFVFQETALFDATAAENIATGKPDATQAEIRRAAELAGAHEFIRELPKGYDTPLGRAGGKLSVGQKQRLSIARALVREAPILILDEPTSALDSETEQRLVASLREASRGRIVIVIAHRLSTVRSADQILFVEEGHVIERGSHAELMTRPAGAYRRFVEFQTRGARQETG